MDSTNKELPLTSKTYFLKQGQSISKLYALINHNVLTHRLKKWFSVLIELILYVLFLLGVSISITIPTNINLFIAGNDDTSLTGTINNEDFYIVMLCIKLVIFLISLPILFFAIVLMRNRKKNNLIHKVFSEVKEMKETFNKALTDLNL
ncbi:MAG: hypothetical protein SFY56_14990 [Bacteroidota bacterium]|nr:hypothetical protein [Bacteroidota bacterium]